MFFMRETLEPTRADASSAPQAQRLPDRDELREILLELTDDLTRDASVPSHS